MTLCRLAVTVFSLTMAKPIPSKSNRPNGLRRSGSNPHCYWAQTAQTTQQPILPTTCRGRLAPTARKPTPRSTRAEPELFVEADASSSRRPLGRGEPLGLLRQFADQAAHRRRSASSSAATDAAPPLTVPGSGRREASHGISSHPATRSLRGADPTELRGSARRAGQEGGGTMCPLPSLIVDFAPARYGCRMWRLVLQSLLLPVKNGPIVTPSPLSVMSS
jgi:hypothetical protein